MAGFGLPNFGQLTEAFKKAQEIQQNAQALQDELDGMEIEGRTAMAAPAFGCRATSNRCGYDWTQPCCRRANRPAKRPPLKPCRRPMSNPPPR